MESNRLSQLVSDLRNDMQQPGDIDAAGKAAIDARLAELETLLAAHDEPLNDQLTRMASEFEAEHPKAARLLESMADTLSKLGI